MSAMKIYKFWYLFFYYNKSVIPSYRVTVSEIVFGSRIFHKLSEGCGTSRARASLAHAYVNVAGLGHMDVLVTFARTLGV